MKQQKISLVFIISGLLIITTVIPNTYGGNVKENSNKVMNLIISGSTIIVDNEGDGNATKIQDAIDISKDGDTIFVYSGTYVENIVVNKQVSIIGINSEFDTGDDIGKPIVDGNKKGSVIKVVADNVNISGLQIQNSGSEGGWDVVDSGVWCYNSNFITLKDNYITENLDGIFVDGSNYVVVQNNEFYYNNWNGLDIYKCKNTTVLNNEFFNDGIMAFDTEQNQISDNTINGQKIIYLEGKTDLTVDEEVGQVILFDCQNIRIINQYISNTNVGMIIYNSTKINISHCTVSDVKWYGILLGHSVNNTIIFNSIFENNIGIYLRFSSNENKIIYNNISNHTYQGILIKENSDENLIYKNNFFSNKYNAWDECNNQWDNGTGGNFWSDHWYKKDTNYDGISERPYYIPLKGIDRHPFMAPIGNDTDPIPPTLEIEIPKEGYLHFGNSIDPYPMSSGKTVIFALPTMSPLEIKVRASDNSGLPTVMLFFDEYNVEELWNADFLKLESVGAGSDLYKVKLEKWRIGTHKLTFIAFDRYGTEAPPVEMELFFFYFPHPAIVP